MEPHDGLSETTAPPDSLDGRKPPGTGGEPRDPSLYESPPPPRVPPPPERTCVDADGDGVEDELRIVDASGNPMTLNRSRRSWSASQARWKVSADDAYHARHSESTAQLQNGEMRVDGRYVDADGKTVLTRTRYFDIGAAAFRMQQDRSTDDGQTWDEAVLTIDAKRTAATAASP